MKRSNMYFLGLLLVFVASLTLASCGGNQAHDHDHDHTEAGHDHEGHDHSDTADAHEGHDHDNGSTAGEEKAAEQGPEYTSAYICPMHCEGSGSDEPGKCPVCGMDYVANADLKKE